MYQAGVKNITLYENKGITFDFWDALDLRQVSNIATLGQIITIENMQRPEYEIESRILNSGKLGHDYKMKFLFLGLTLENYDFIFQIYTSIYGWCFLVEFYDGTFRFYNTPLFSEKEKINPHNEMSFEVNLFNPIPSVQQYYEYTPGVSGTPVFRWDTTLLTWDTEIYTFDYDQ